MAEKNTTKKTTADEKTSFEEAIARLEALVRELEDGRLPLAASLDLFSEGIGLARLCDQYLDEAEQRLAVLTAKENGELELKEAD